jgi:hypothetical protein
VRDRIIGIPGEIEDLCIGRDFQDLLSQLAAIHRRHDYIRDQPPDFSAILFADGRAFLGAFRDQQPTIE